MAAEHTIASQPDPAGAVVLHLLDTWHFWVKRRVESITFPDIDTVERKVSIDFELPARVLQAAANTDPHTTRATSRVTPGSYVGIRERPLPICVIPLTLLRKQGLTQFSLRDEGGAALPLLTRDQNGEIALATMLELAAGLRDEPPGRTDLPETIAPELVTELRKIATGAPKKAMEVWRDLDRIKDSDNSPHCGDWRTLLVHDKRFMALALDFARNFLVLTPVPVEPGRRRIIKLSYEQHAPGASGKATRADLDEPSADSADAARRRRGTGGRRLSSHVGWQALIRTIDIPAVGQGRCYHLEVEAPDTLQVTRGKLTVWIDKSGLVRAQDPPLKPPLDDYPDYPDVVRYGVRRLHIHRSVPASTTGRATIHLRPRASTIVRAACITAFLTAGLLVVATFAWRSFQSNVGSSVTLLLLAPGGLAAIIARPREPYVATDLLFGLRLLTLACGLWAFAVAGALLVGQHCTDTMVGTKCTPSPHTQLLVGICTAGCMITALVLARTWRLVSSPPEAKEGVRGTDSNTVDSMKPIENQADGADGR